MGKKTADVVFIYGFFHLHTRPYDLHNFTAHERKRDERADRLVLLRLPIVNNVQAA